MNPVQERTQLKPSVAESVERAVPLIQMRNIVKIFRTPAGDFPALRGIDVDIYPGEFVSVVGKSGSGKSTLVNMLTGIDYPTSGSVRINGVEVHEMGESARARWRGRNLGIVFQFYQLLPTLSLLENTLLPMDIAGAIPLAAREARALALLKRVGVAADAYKLPAAVSGGQQQCAAIARALANDPPIIIADEPTGNLDSRTAEHIFRIFAQLAEQGRTVIMVTHDPTLLQRTTRSVLLADGEVIDEVVAGALPQLTHQQMLALTQQAQRCRFAPGDFILREGEDNDSLYLIGRGTVEVTLDDPRGGQQTLARLGPGQYFGEISLLQPSRATANVRAVAEPVEVLALPRAIITHLLAEAQTWSDELSRVLRERLAENVAARRLLGMWQEPFHA